MRQNKKYTKRTLLLGFVVVMGLFCLTGCSDFFQTLADGKNAVIDGATDVKDSAIDGLTDAKDTVLDAAAQAIGDGPKDAILGAFDAFADATGKIALTEDGSLQGNRIIGEDNYTGSYKADYNNYSDTEILFGGTALERESGDTVKITCSLDIDNGEAIIFLRSGAEEPVALLNDTGEYTATLDVSGNSTYIGVWGDNYTGSVSINIE